MGVGVVFGLLRNGGWKSSYGPYIHPKQESVYEKFYCTSNHSKPLAGRSRIEPASIRNPIENLSIGSWESLGKITDTIVY